MAQVFPLELYPDYIISVSLFVDVSNTAYVKERLLNGKLDAAIVRVSMLSDLFPVLLATNKAVHSFKLGKMKTRSIYSEVLYNLSPSNNITASLKRFGIQESDSTLLVVCILKNESDKEKKIEEILSQIEGKIIAVDELPTFSDVKEITEVYKVTEDELKVGSLTDAIVCRIAAKDAT